MQRVRVRPQNQGEEKQQHAGEDVERSDRSAEYVVENSAENSAGTSQTPDPVADRFENRAGGHDQPWRFMAERVHRRGSLLRTALLLRTGRRVTPSDFGQRCRV